MMKKNVLVGFECSQTVALAFEKMGFHAVSCDIKHCTGFRPDIHIQEDIFFALELRKWDLIILHPPCTYTCLSGNAHYSNSPLRLQGADLCNRSWQRANEVCSRVVLEQPKTVMQKWLGKKSQVIQPWQFGHPESKETWLWVRGLPLLEPTKFADFKRYRCKCGNVFTAQYGKYGCCDGPAVPCWDNQTKSGQNKIGKSPNRSEIRSNTYPGIADAMAKQWGQHILNNA